MKLIPIKTSLECILFSGLCIYVWNGDKNYLITYDEHKSKPFKVDTMERCYELSSVNDIIRVLAELSNFNIESLEIEITH